MCLYHLETHFSTEKKKTLKVSQLFENTSTIKKKEEKKKAMGVLSFSALASVLGPDC